ncbi:MAG TPA: glycosyltransferase family 2 protein [Terriglobales bacterium]|nr:glycosyltransferase family 2 protein [Terriglobales bacterium]
MLKPLVSVIINNYNYERFVGEAISSALRQTYDRMEVIVVDDGSSDDSRAVIEGYGKEIVSVFKTNEGQASAFNAGFSKSSGQIICLLDADDIFLPNKVEKVVEAYKNDKTGWCFHPLQWVDIIARPIAGSPDLRYATGNYDFRRQYLRGKPVFWAAPTSGLTFRRSLLEKLLPMPKHIRITGDNYLTFTSPAFAPGFYISECLSLQRVHGANAYTANDDGLFKATVQISIARGLHDSFPELARLANRLFANALAAKWTAGAEFKGLWGELRQYLGDCAVSEKIEVLTRMAYRIFRPRRPRVAASIGPGIRPTPLRDLASESSLCSEEVMSTTSEGRIRPKVE